MGGQRRAVCLGLAGGLAAAGVVGACGSRTGLLVDETVSLANPTATQPRGGGSDGGSKPSKDGGLPGSDSGTLPPITSPTPTTPEPLPPGCPPDGGTSSIYVLTQSNHVYGFSPPATFSEVGLLDCITNGVAAAAAMAIARNGLAYILFSDGELFQMDTTEFPMLEMGGPAGTIPCMVTTHMPGLGGDVTFGMAYVGTPDGGEALYAIPSDESELDTIDPQMLDLGALGPLGPVNVAGASLSGTSDGRLFAFYGAGSGSAVTQIDPSLVEETARTTFPSLALGSGFAIAFFGDVLYLFTAPAPATGTGSSVTQLDTLNGSVVTTPITIDEIIVGAGVSTCAPAQ